MTTTSSTSTVLRKAEQFQVNAAGGVIRANKPIVGGTSADGVPSAALFYWSHSHFTGDFEFGLHHHEGFEIVTFVLEGENSHFDTAGSDWTPLHGGDVQIIRSGSGISHNERIVKDTRAFQIWFDPGYHAALEKTPDYTDHPASTFSPHPLGDLDVTEYIGGDGPVQSSVEGLSVRRMTVRTPTTQTISLGSDRYSVLYVIAGPATVDGYPLSTDDAIILRGNEEFVVDAGPECDLFLISLPANPGYAPVRGR